MSTVLLIVVLGLLGVGVLFALGLLVHLAWFWFSGQDYRTAEERAWEESERRALPRGLRAGVTSELPRTPR